MNVILIERPAANPKEEFKNDPMLRELHEGMVRRYEIIKNKSPEERVEYFGGKKAKNVKN